MHQRPSSRRSSCRTSSGKFSAKVTQRRKPQNALLFARATASHNMPRPRKLTAAQEAHARLLSSRGYTVEQIARRLCVKRGIIYRLCDPRYQLWRANYARTVTEERTSTTFNKHRVKHHHVPPHLIDDRDQRSALKQFATITSQVFGDPPPGYSALDRQHAERSLLPQQGMARPPSISPSAG